LEIAPILVSVYNRLNHFKRCISSLKNCYLSDKSHLFVAIDAPKTELDSIANKKIIEYSYSIKGFKRLSIIERENNCGPLLNRQIARDEIFSIYNSIIQFEDDNIFSKDFLLFMNKGLNTFEGRKDIFSISGYNYPFNIPDNYKDEIYLWTGFSGWGSGIWRNKWKMVDWDKDSTLNQLFSVLKKPSRILKFHNIANHYLPAILLMLEKKVIHGDGYLSLFQYLNGLYSVFPISSRVRNIGHDGSGENCGVTNTYISQEIYSGHSNYQLNYEIKPSPELDKMLQTHFKKGILSKSKSLFRLIKLLIC